MACAKIACYALASITSLALCLSCLVGCVSPSQPDFKTEHIALEVASPEQTAEWWCRNLGFEIAEKMTVPPFAIFIREKQGKFAIELCRAPNAGQAPDYHEKNPLQFHIAFLSTHPEEDVGKLATAGATVVSRQKVNGSELILLRDPSGIPLQLVQRQKPVLK